MFENFQAEKNYTKFDLTVYLIFYFGTSLFYAAVLFMMRCALPGSHFYSDEVYSTTFVCYTLGYLIAHKSRGSWSDKFTDFRIEHVFIARQRLLGVLLIIGIMAAVNWYYVNTTYSFKLIYMPTLVTCLITIPIVLFVDRDKKTKTQSISKANKQVDTVFWTGDFGPECKEKMHGSAKWMTDDEKNEYTSHGVDGKPNFEGLWLGGGFFHHRQGNLMTVAPPGTGKGTALIIPNLLWKRNYKHSFVVFDPKGTNACITARWRKEQGDKVIIIDPMGLQQLNKARHGIEASCFNPLDHIEGDIFNGTAQIANLLLPDEPGVKDKYWNTDARNLIQLILMHIMTCDTFDGYRDLTSLHQVIISGKISAVIKEAVTSEAMDGLIADTASGFATMIEKSEKTFASVLSIASASIKWLSNPALQRTLQQSDFTPAELEEGGMTVYICQPIANKEGFATFSRLITGFCLRANSMPTASAKAWVYYLLDEFPTMGIFPEVIEALAFAREYNMRIWLFAQSLSQIDSLYKPETRHEILGSTGIFQSFRVKDHVTAEYVSKRLGNQTVRYEVQNRSVNSGSNYGSSFSSGGDGKGSSSSSSGSSSGESAGISETYQARPLRSPDEVERESNIITFISWGPMRLFPMPYYYDQSFIDFDMYRAAFLDGRADPNPNMLSKEKVKQIETATEKETVIDPVPIPALITIPANH